MIHLSVNKISRLLFKGRRFFYPGAIMDKIIAVIILIAVILFLFFGELYFKLDKARASARFCFKKMEPKIREWLSLSEELVNYANESSKEVQKYRSLTDSYNSLSKKDSPSKVHLLNSIHESVCSVVSDNIDNPEILKTGRNLSSVYRTFSSQQLDYNVLVLDLNGRLERSLYQKIGKIMKIPPLEKLHDLSVL